MIKKHKKLSSSNYSVIKSGTSIKETLEETLEVLNTKTMALCVDSLVTLKLIGDSSERQFLGLLQSLKLDGQIFPVLGQISQSDLSSLPRLQKLSNGSLFSHVSLKDEQLLQATVIKSGGRFEEEQAVLKNGKLTKVNPKLHNHLLGVLLEQSKPEKKIQKKKKPKQKKEEKKIEIEEEKPEEPTSSFNLSMSTSERDAWDNVVLPLFKSENKPQTVPEVDSDDEEEEEEEEEDPDADLDF